MVNENLQTFRLLFLRGVQTHSSLGRCGALVFPKLAVLVIESRTSRGEGDTEGEKRNRSFPPVSVLSLLLWRAVGGAGPRRGTNSGSDGVFGTVDDLSIPGFNPAIVTKIASINLGGRIVRTTAPMSPDVASKPSKSAASKSLAAPSSSTRGRRTTIFLRRRLHSPGCRDWAAHS